MNNLAESPVSLPARHWRAHLQLDFEVRPAGAGGTAPTRITRSRHTGPLRIQRPFYPEGDCCHCYILHPPGGIVTGDHLTLQANLNENAQALITTPSAGRVYTQDSHGHPQYQGIAAKLAAGSCLEWLPQETILYDGAKVELINRFELARDARLIGWDFICLGRRASGESFNRGQCIQLIELVRDNKLLLRERTRWQGGSKMLSAAWGMANFRVAGTLFATLDLNRQQLDELRQSLAQQNLPGEWGLSQKPGVLLARFLGDSAEQGRRGFECIWRTLRPLLNNRPACRPRIWNT